MVVVSGGVLGVGSGDTVPCTGLIATASVRHEARCLSIRFTEAAELTISFQSTDPLGPE